MLAQKPGRVRLKSDCECHHFTSQIRERETGCDIPQGTSQIRDRIRMKFRNTEVPVCCLVTESFLYSAFSHDSPFRLRDRFTYESWCIQCDQGMSKSRNPGDISKSSICGCCQIQVVNSLFVTSNLFFVLKWTHTFKIFGIIVK